MSHKLLGTLARALGSSATVLLLSTSWLGDARADSPSRVVVVRAANQSATVDEATTRLRAELTSSGFEVVTVDARADADPRDTVEDPAFHSVAALSIVSTSAGTAIDVWVADSLTHKTLVRRVDVDARATKGASVVLAIRAVELLRASLLEAPHLPADLDRFVQAKPSASPPTPSAPPASSSIPSSIPSSLPSSPSPSSSSQWPSRPPTWISWPSRPFVPSPPSTSGPFAFGLGLATLAHFDGNPPSFGPELHAELRLHPRVHLRADIVAPLFTWARRRPEGSISLREGLGVVGVAVPLIERGPVVPSTYLGIGIDVAHAAGNAAPPYRAQSADVASFVTMPGASVEFRCTDHFSILTDARVPFAFPGATLRIAGHDVGRIGRSSFLGSIGFLVIP